MTKTSVNADGIFEPFSSETVAWEEWEHGRFASRYRPLGRFGGGSHVGVAMEELAPGMHSCPLHYHMLEEEHLYMLEGSLTLSLGDKTHIMQTGDYVCFPAGQKAGHALFNHTDKPCRYLILGESNPNDVMVYPKSGRVGVRLLNEGYNGKATMEYWEGQD